MTMLTTLNYNPINLLGLFAGCLSLMGTVPQLIKSWRIQSTKDISLLAITLGFTSGVLWLIYGIYQHDLALIVSNSIGITLVSILIFTKLHFG